MNAGRRIGPDKSKMPAFLIELVKRHRSVVVRGIFRDISLKQVAFHMRTQRIFNCEGDAKARSTLTVPKLGSYLIVTEGLDSIGQDPNCIQM